MNSDKSDILTLQAQLKSGKTSCVEITEDYLSSIKENIELNAFITVCGDHALKKAHTIDRKITKGTMGPLAGMVVAVKDNIALQSIRMTCGSRILDDFIPPFSATVVRRLEEADAIIIGKTNMDEFGMGSSNENSAFGHVKNPRDIQRVPGGSSGGSAAAVAAGMAMTALGSDTGGSIRQPASFTGTIGLRPTYGHVSRYGLISFASSFDQIGCIANTAIDCYALFHTIAGYDVNDATTVDVRVPNDFSLPEKNIKGLTIGLPKEYIQSNCDDDVMQAIQKIIDTMRLYGAVMKKISLPSTEYGIAAYYLIANAEASANLARFDGVRYGLRYDHCDELNEMYIKTRGSGFGNEVKRRIILGTYTLSSGYYDAYYKKAQKVRTIIRQELENAFLVCDIIIGPTTPTTAFKIGEIIDDPLKMYLTDIFTVLSPLSGLPAISVPVGVDSKGLPVGLQLTGKSFSEEELLCLTQWIQKKINE